MAFLFKDTPTSQQPPFFFSHVRLSSAEGHARIDLFAEAADGALAVHRLFLSRSFAERVLEALNLTVERYQSEHGHIRVTRSTALDDSKKLSVRSEIYVNQLFTVFTPADVTLDFRHVRVFTPKKTELNYRFVATTIPGVLPVLVADVRETLKNKP